jgi:hypothetical protein
VKRLIVILCFCALHASAQNGFFLQGDFGAGISNISAPGPPPDGVVDNVIGLVSEVGAGYQYRHWDAKIGVSFLKTGSHAWEKNLNGKSRTEYYDHILLPLLVEYGLPVSRSMAILPSAGVAFSYNLQVRQTIGMRGLASSTGSVLIADTYLEQTSFFAVIGCNLAYAVNPVLKITAGPQWYRMITSMVDNPFGRTYQYNYAYTFNLGIRWLFHRHWSQSLEPEPI